MYGRFTGHDTRKIYQGFFKYGDFGYALTGCWC